MRAPGHPYSKGNPGSSRSEHHQKWGCIGGVMSTYALLRVLSVHGAFPKHQNIKFMEIRYSIEN